MSDPYKVLNISPTASDDEVKHAYRELARKYHPDNYHDNPLADLAQEKMKEINEAYDQIQKQRKNGASSAHYQYEYSSYREESGSPLLREVRLAINRGDITLAERLLNEAPEHNAEWNYLMGVVCFRRGWLDDAKRCFEAACRMDPANEEYLEAMERFSGRNYYRPEAYRASRSMTYRDDTCVRLCTAWSCCMLSGGRCFFC